MAKNHIEVLAGKAIENFLASKSDLLVSGMTSNGRPVRLPAVTTSPATPPTDSGPFITILVSGRTISFADSSPLAISGSAVRVTIVLEDNIEIEANDDQPYKRSSENHSNIGDRIIGELVKILQVDGAIAAIREETGTGFPFKIIPGDGIQKANSGAGWKAPGYYAIAVSDIVFSLRSACEQETY